MKKALVAMFIAAFLFSSMEVALKLSGEMYHPLQLNFLRFMIGGLILLVPAHRMNRALPWILPRFAYGYFAMTGFVCVVLAMSLYMWSVRLAPASTVAIVFSSNAFFGIIFAGLFLGQQVSRQTAIALGFAGLGLLLIAHPWDVSNIGIGLLLTLGSAVLFAIYACLLKYGQRKILHQGLIPTTYSFLFGAGELGLLMLIGHIPAVAAWLNAHDMGLFADVPFFQGINMETLPMLLYVGVFVSGIGFAAHAMAISCGSVTIGSIAFLIKPLLSPLMAFVVLAETQSLWSLIGLGILTIASLSITLENAGISLRLTFAAEHSEVSDD